MSKIRYGLEISAEGNDREITPMQRMQIRVARLCFVKKRKDWSLTKWLSVPQLASEATIM